MPHQGVTGRDGLVTLPKGALRARLALAAQRSHYVIVRFRSSVPALLISVTLAPLVCGLAACGPTMVPCAGQCAPPFVMQVTFRAGTSPQAAAAAMRTCASKPFVVRVGKVTRAQGSPGQRTAMVYTQAMHGHQNGRLLGCLRRSPLVFSAGYGD